MIQVGQVLDKYELLERVGQGGMAVVYRGLDRSLKRVVAVKVLHKHLADYQEARDRFEREAQAVAKLRHENILEIFDYAARPDEEAYIVTEFIDGQTLKQVITDRPLQFPEIGAMLILQVGRALAHAHAGGILHRDVKPENVMIRSDGVVKLMDFGISHMVDLERLTVTGQLLGSPAYMAPEHVEGRPLDFRTDVFALGIVLYQLTVGKLPFEGKNPHEVLKRIAECRFVDPRTANPRIGNRLGRIILRAMAAQPNDRYPAIGEMVAALEAYLDESGIPSDKIAGELARYFAAPASYEQALEDRLVDHLTRRGKQLLAQDDRAAALDVFDRVLSIDADNEAVIGILDGINRRLRLRAIGMGLVAAMIISGGAYMIHRKNAPPGADTPVLGSAKDIDVARVQRAGADDPPPPVADDVVASDVDAGAVAVGPVVGPRPVTIIDGGVVAPAAQGITVVVSPAKGARVKFGDEPWVDVTPEDNRLMRTIDHPILVRVQNDACCIPTEQMVQPGAEVPIQLGYKPASITPKCAIKDAVVRIDGQSATLDQATPVFFTAVFDVKTVAVEWTTTQNWTQKVTLHPGDKPEVKCEPPH